MSLAIKYRPPNFDEMVGNESTIQSIEAILKRNPEDIPHAWLFTGPSGCGKTTLARIVAEQLGCRGSDFYEVDAADFRGIDTIREMRRQMNYKAMEGSCRVWLLDECHQISKDGQEALLKALEDAPSHVYFLLATTDPQKLKPTLKNRCVDFNVQSVGERNMVEFLEEIVEAEDKSVPKDILKSIAKYSIGSCRAALQTLEKVIDLPEKDMEAAAEKEATKENAVIDLCRSLMVGEKWNKISAILKGIEGEEPESTRLAVMGYASAVLLSGKDVPLAYVIMDSFKEPLYANGRAGLVLMAYEAMSAIHEGDIPF